MFWVLRLKCLSNLSNGDGGPLGFYHTFLVTYSGWLSSNLSIPFLLTHLTLYPLIILSPPLISLSLSSYIFNHLSQSLPLAQSPIISSVLLHISSSTLPTFLSLTFTFYTSHLPSPIIFTSSIISFTVLYLPNPNNSLHNIGMGMHMGLFHKIMTVHLVTWISTTMRSIIIDIH